MTSVVLTTVSKALKDEFSKVQEGLKDVETSIRKLTGREPDRTRDVRKRSNPDQWNDGVTRKRIASFIRQESPPAGGVESEPAKKPALMSTIVTTAKTVKPVKPVTENQNRDCNGLARNKRMFGMILGTLQKFQTEESRRSTTTQRREEIEKKLEKEAEQEKANVRKERTELFKELRDKQAMERKLQLKIERVESHEHWEKAQAPLTSFIQTKAKPCIFYLPKKMTLESEKRLKDTKDKYRMIIAEKRAKVQKDLNDIEELYQKEIQAIDDPEAVTRTAVAGSESNEQQLKQQVVEQNHDIGAASAQDPPDSNGAHVRQENDRSAEEDKKVDPEVAGATPDGIGNKEFEPIYDDDE